MKADRSSRLLAHLGARASEGVHRRQFLKFQLKGALWLLAGAAGLSLPRTLHAAATPDVSVVKGEVGAATAMLILTGLRSPHAKPGPGRILHPAIIRPPGAVPEYDFLARCIRCGECMQACPTNSLQPLGLEAGLSALFSPVIVPRRGPCDPHCTACGSVCPTRAIRLLTMTERIKAKVGTARLDRQKCLAMELEKKCLICDEVCPFDAVEFRQLAGMRTAVPFVNESRCAGCGYCEHFCPVQATPAIVVEPMLALRLARGSYRAAARERGYSLEIGQRRADIFSSDEGREAYGPPQPDATGLPPGFTE